MEQHETRKPPRNNSYQGMAGIAPPLTPPELPEASTATSTAVGSHHPNTLAKQLPHMEAAAAHEGGQGPQPGSSGLLPGAGPANGSPQPLQGAGEDGGSAAELSLEISTASDVPGSPLPSAVVRDAAEDAIGSILTAVASTSYPDAAEPGHNRWPPEESDTAAVGGEANPIMEGN
eukprot:CAMPEP_0117660012 /NCGR_PEP_ID=MMETSP0804-20121206/6737_1 /TAXON_ID=1074897 /ORGANISM="Tetraselmis astigmatica, Strain CCMP880" /LENGTH=174 /DNA_ID=CAMNT_0005466705 /DNA_START=116 /DNA_END=637 /DNA_ORIENTATION=-